MKNINYVALIASIVSIVSVFLPWIEASSSASFGGYSASYSSDGIAGISISGGILGLILSIIGAFLVFNKQKFSFVVGTINLINGLGYMLGVFGLHGGGEFSSSFGEASASATVDPQIGLFVFTIASFLYVIFTLKYLKKQKLD